MLLADEKYLKEKGYYQDLYAEYNLHEPNSKTSFMSAIAPEINGNLKEISPQ